MQHVKTLQSNAMFFQTDYLYLLEEMTKKRLRRKKVMDYLKNKNMKIAHETQNNTDHLLHYIENMEEDWGRTEV